MQQNFTHTHTHTHTYLSSLTSLQSVNKPAIAVCVNMGSYSVALLCALKRQSKIFICV
jgi:hypothetical protein